MRRAGEDIGWRAVIDDDTIGKNGDAVRAAESEIHVVRGKEETASIAGQGSQGIA